MGTQNFSDRHHHALVIAALIVLAALLIVLFSHAAAAGGQARKMLLAEGQQEYTENCAYCHGTGADGTGALAPSLVKPPKDLTAISANSGGPFPFWRVFDIIAGETPVAGHDTHQMPEYFARLKSQDNKPGYLPAHVRILELTHYLESIQKK